MRRFFARLDGGLRALFLRRQSERDVADELQHYLDEAVARKMADEMPADAARREAHVELGSVEALKDDVRDVGWERLITRAWQDARYAFRVLRTAPTVTAVVVLSVGLGITANVVLFSALNGLLFRTVPARDPGSLVRLRWTGPNDVINEHSEYAPNAAENAAFSFAMFQELAASNQTMSDLIACAPFGRVNVVVSGSASAASAFIASGNYFRGLGVAASVGRLFDVTDDAPAATATAVLSHSYWKAHFGGDPSVVNTFIRVNDIPVMIIGVSPPEFSGIQQPMAEAPDITFPLILEPVLRGDRRPAHVGGTSTSALVTVRSNSGDPANWWLELVGRLKPSMTSDQVEANLGPIFQETTRLAITNHLASLSAKDRADSDRAVENVPRLRVERGQYGVYDADRSELDSLVMLSGAVGILLAVVCANVANLLLSRAVSRGREIAIRLSMGATRARIVRQMLSESLLMSVMGAALALAAAGWLKAVIPVVGPPAPIDWRVLVFTASLSVLCALACGLAPALVATRDRISSSLRPRSLGVTQSRPRLGRPLLIVQIALSLMLLIGASLFVRTTWNLRHVNVGFDPKNVVLFTVTPSLNHYEPAHVQDLYGQMLDRLPNLPGVRSAALSQPALLSGTDHVGGVYIQDRRYDRGRESHDRMHEMTVSPDFFRTMGLDVVQGRTLTAQDRENAPPVVVINEAAAAAYFPNGAIGRRLGWNVRNADHFEIVGVVRNVKFNSLRSAPPATMYESYLQAETSTVTFEIKTATDPAAAIPAIREAVRQIDPNVPILDVTTQTDRIEDRFRRERALAETYSAFGVMVVLLTALGVFGVMSYSVARRTGEIGIRMALGAQRLDVQTAVLRESMGTVFAGIGTGVVGALLSGRVVRAMLFGVSASDGPSIATAITIMLGVCAAASYLPARRASHLNPIVALRLE